MSPSLVEASWQVGAAICSDGIPTDLKRRQDETMSHCVFPTVKNVESIVGWQSYWCAVCTCLASHMLRCNATPKMLAGRLPLRKAQPQCTGCLERRRRRGCKLALWFCRLASGWQWYWYRHRSTTNRRILAAAAKNQEHQCGDTRKLGWWLCDGRQCHRQPTSTKLAEPTPTPSRQPCESYFIITVELPSRQKPLACFDGLTRLSAMFSQRLIRSRPTT